ncbi:hypothetical protein [Methanobrevibacter curvatus]|uniref:Proteasome-activating nucleotidase n=1 Tax=Methanobrevibacter curvatus TaxID=49547 RepID=A0A162FM66_9EURY|nr:hypothetical protein [Methanobrevibacter curvatus]KZX12070.1 proteasome-activating nucleotidase [Methanobrevibacter curvatus]
MKTKIKILKEETVKTERILTWKVRKLEKDKTFTENNKIKLEREISSLKNKVERFRTPLILLVTITEVINDSSMTAKSSSSHYFFLKSFSFLLTNYIKFVN